MQSTEHCIRRTDRGKRNEGLVADLIAKQGFIVSVTPFSFRKTKKEIVNYRDEIDLYVGPNRLPVDVKSRRLRFTGPHDYPYETAFVDTVKGWESKTVKPVAIVLYSELTGCACAVRTSREAEWTKTHAFDRDAGIYDEFYLVRRSDLATFNEFIQALRLVC